MIRVAHFADLDTVTLYALLRLRTDVFVVEQGCAYPELDGRDLEPATLHLWIDEGDGRPLAYLRILDGPPAGVTRIGRVVTEASARARGLARQLLDEALARVGRPVVLDAQAYLVDWYTRAGFVVDGPEYVDDGIPHVPMRRP